ncbi:MAG: glycosyltransferase [candidate division Zixibacteria bacterium]|nr:glycosyltransferase [candidate division Zixibacteria bacterium]
MSGVTDYILIVAIVFGVAYSLVESLILIVELRRSRKRIPHNVILPPITVFKPLKGLDSRLEDNLRSFFELDYPEYELLFGINDLDDPAIDVVKKLRRAYPDVKSRLVVTEFRVGPNPKVNNLYNMYPYARFAHLVISDSNVRVDRDYLTHMAAEMQSDQVGLVTSAIRGVAGNSIGSLFENLHLNTFIVGNVFAVKRLFKIPITIGKSMLFRREALERIGGFRALVHYLAEDHMLGQKISALGMETRTSPHCIHAVNSGWPLGQFINRHLRWATMRRHVNIYHYAIEILSNPVLFALLFLLKNPRGFGMELFATVFLAKTCIDMIAARFIRAEERWYYYLLTPIKDLLIAGIWIVPFFSYTVNWRGNYFLIGSQTQLTRLSRHIGAFDWTIAGAYSAAFRDKHAVGNLSFFQRSLWFAGMAGKSTFSGTRRLISRRART